MKMVVYLKGGGVIEVDATKFEVKRRTIDDGDFTSITWTTPTLWGAKLVSINPSQIAAVVEKRSWWRRIF